MSHLCCLVVSNIFHLEKYLLTEILRAWERFLSELALQKNLQKMYLWMGQEARLPGKNGAGGIASGIHKASQREKEINFWIQ